MALQAFKMLPITGPITYKGGGAREESEESKRFPDCQDVRLMVKDNKQVDWLTFEECRQ